MSPETVLGLMFGGKSSEHEVSLASAASVIGAVDRRRYAIVPIGIRKDGSLASVAQMWRMLPLAAEAKKHIGLRPNGSKPLVRLQSARAKSLVALVAPRRFRKIDVIFPVLHGPFGEDGTIQGLLELAGIPYVGSGVTGSGVGMDKEVMKRVFRDAGLPVVPFIVFNSLQWEKMPEQCLGLAEEKLPYPYFVKPVNLGSSVGVSKSMNRAQLRSHIELAFQFDTRVMVEQAVSAREVECAVLGNEEPEVSVPGEIISSHDFYDYVAKYKDKKLKLVVPAPLAEQQVDQLRTYSRQSFQLIQAAGLSRVDFFIENGTDRVFVNEINTIPGFTAVSMYPKLWEASGIRYSELINRLIQLGIERARKKARLRVS